MFRVFSLHKENQTIMSGSLVKRLSNDILISHIKYIKGKSLLQGELAKEVNIMAVHHGGKVGKAGKTLASNSTSKSSKSKAGATLANHKAAKH